MVDYIPQDEYFEWEDILVYRQNDHVTQVREMGLTTSTLDFEESFTPTLSVEKNIEASIFCWDDAEIRTGELPDGATASPRSTSTSVSPIMMPDSAKVPSPINFPSYDDQAEESSRLQLPIQPSIQIAKDDLDAYLHPSRCVDYFSHQWSLEDMSTSWRHVRTREKSSKNAERLENASWRSWAKMCFGLTTVPPETVNWMKDLDDICLYGPFQATTWDDEVVTTCDKISKPILKRPSISELLLQGSQLSWTGSRRRSTGSSKCRKTRRSVKFNHIIEHCITVGATPQKNLPRTKAVTFKSAAASTISSAPIVVQEQNHENVDRPSFWSPPAFLQPKAESVVAPSDISQWTWLIPSEEDELDWISPQPNFVPSAYTPAHPSPASIVRDLAAKSHYVPTRRFQNQPIREQTPSDEEDEDEMMAQYLFDCDFKSDSDTLSPSDSSSSEEDRDEEDVDFFDSGDLADEKRIMEKLHEIPMMERMKQTLFEQVVDEVSLDWE